jgi:hypothetical protein
MDQIDKSVMKDALVEAFAAFQLKKIIKNELLKAINEEKWITIHPHGDVEDEDGHKDYRRIKLEDGETPKEAIERIYKKDNGKTDKGEKGNEEVNGNKKETEDLSKRIQELEEKAKKFGGENTVLGKKYLNQAEELKKQQKQNEQLEFDKLKDDKDILNKLSEMSKKIDELYNKKWNYTYGTSERDKIESQLSELNEKASELSKKISLMGKSWDSPEGTRKLLKFEDGRFVVSTDKTTSWGTSTDYSYYSDFNKINELKEADKKGFEKAQKKKQEKQERVSRKVNYKKGEIPKAKSREEAEKIAEKYNLADNINYGTLSVDICNALNESANDIYSEFPKIRELNKEFGSLQAKNRNLIDEAFEVQGESLSVTIRERMESLRKKYGDEYFEKYYGDTKTVEKKITEKVKDILKKKIGVFRASGEIAHCRYTPPSQSGIVWNEKFKNSKNFDYTCEAGFHPQNSGSLKAIADHEFGHMIDRFVQLKGKSNSVSYRELESYYKTLSKNDIKSGLSEYASKTFAEFIAEGFSEYKNNPNPRPISQKIGNLLTKAYKEIEDYV